VLLQIAISVLLLVWLALSLSGQVSTRAERALGSTVLGPYLPRWRLFAPDPVDRDYHVFTRAINGDAAVSTWILLASPEPRRAWHAVIRPGRRHNKALLDVCTATARAAREQPHERLHSAWPYRFLLQCARDRHPGAAAVQFLILSAQTFDREPRYALGLLSDVHSV
jgi:hypothetical protein